VKPRCGCGGPFGASPLIRHTATEISRSGNYKKGSGNPALLSVIMSPGFGAESFRGVGNELRRLPPRENERRRCQESPGGRQVGFIFCIGPEKKRYTHSLTRGCLLKTLICVCNIFMAIEDGSIKFGSCTRKIIDAKEPGATLSLSSDFLRFCGAFFKGASLSINKSKISSDLLLQFSI
jgi:hypothetical protein